MRIRYAFTAAAFATVLVASPSLAQVCEGRPGADAGKVQLGAGFSAGNAAKEFGVGVSGLGERAYGGATLGSVSYDDFSGSTTTIGGSVGYQLAVGSSGRAQLCPFFRAALGFGPNDIAGLGVDLSTRGVGAGISWGFRATQSADFGLIPTIGAGFSYASVKLSDGVDDLTESDTYGQLGIGLGFIFGRQFAVQPTVTIPLGLEGADPIVGVTISLSLGSRQ